MVYEKQRSSFLENFLWCHYMYELATRLGEIWNTLAKNMYFEELKPKVLASLCISKFSLCWGRSLRGHDCLLTPELDHGSWRHFVPSHPPLTLECVFHLPSPLLELLQGCTLEKVIWCWAHPDSICDWTLLRSLYKQELYVSSLAY